MDKFILLVLALSLSVLQVFASAQLPEGFPHTDRVKIELKQGWKFHLGEPNGAFFGEGYDDSHWEDVVIPHTLALTSLTLDGLRDEKTQLQFHRKVGWYRKTFAVSDSKEKRVFLEFEGVHQITDVWVNGKHVGQHSVGGYTPFHFDISDYVRRGKSNQVTVKADNRRSQVTPPDPGPFDYVKFSGLYRDVYLVETSPVHVTFNWESLHSGVSITTPTVDPVNKNASINIKTSVKNEKSVAVEGEVITRVIDKEGLVVLKLADTQTLLPGQEFQFNQIGSLEDGVQLWDLDNPYLYRVNSVVRVQGKDVDFVENKIGLRKFEQDPERGFILNNRPIKLIGFNRHQQYPYVGDAVPDSLHYKDMLQFKEFGFNVMRTAHYPQDNALIEACDELGILAYEEAPTWIAISQDKTWWDNLEQASRVMVRNHRNHPSIVFWGAGVNHRGYVPRLHNAIKQEDPTRLTASQNSGWTGWQTSGLTDVYANMLYGAYLWDRSEPLLGMEGKSGPQAVAPFQQDPKRSGLISWTAHAYYTFHPTHDKQDSSLDRTRSGVMTIFRYPRPELQWYKAELLEEPFIDIKEDWLEGTSSLTVYSNAKEVALSLNGKEIARSGPSKNAEFEGLYHPPFIFEGLNYQAGTVVAKGFFKDGSSKDVAKSTPGEAYSVELELDTKGRDFVADGSDALMAYARIVDRKGTTVASASNLVHFSVQGEASVVGEGKNINANPMFTEYGVAPALIRAGHKAGKITVYAKSEGLKTGKASVRTLPYNPNVVEKTAESIYDFARERVDLGGAGQLRQFGWHHWNGADGEPRPYTFKSFKGATAHIVPASTDGILRWLGEINVIGKYGFAYGDGVVGLGDRGVNLVLNNLPKGNYKLITWHHAPRSNTDFMDPNLEKLKTLTVHKLPYETALKVTSSNLVGGGVEARVTEGKDMQSTQAGTSTVVFKADGKKPVTINYRGRTNKGVWINSLELSEWK